MPPRPPRPSRLASIKDDLQREFVAPAKLCNTPAPAEVVEVMPSPATHPTPIPEEGQVVVDLPRVGATPISAVVTDDGVRTIAPVPDTRRGTSPGKLAQRWTGQVIERLVQHALSDDYRASIPACNILLERAWGKPRPAEPEAEQQAVDMSAMPVRDRIKALLEARGAAPEAKPVSPPIIDPPAPAPEADTSLL